MNRSEFLGGAALVAAAGMIGKSHAAEVSEYGRAPIEADLKLFED